MGELRYTPLRHRMLARVSAGSRETGGICRKRDLGNAAPRFLAYSRSPRRQALTPAEARTVRDIYLAGLAMEVHGFGASMYSARLLGLSKDGSAALAEWDARYGRLEGP